MAGKSPEIPSPKKARYGLPLQIELSVPFLAAGDLNRVAALNRAGRDAARSSYHSRLRSPLVLPRDENKSATVDRSIFQHGDAPLCYAGSNLRWRDAFRWETLFHHNRLSFRDDGSWTLISVCDVDTPRPEEILSFLSEKRLHLPDCHRFGTNTDVVHCSLVDNILVVVFCKTTSVDEGDVEGEIDCDIEDAMKELWGGIYVFGSDVVEHLPSVLRSLGQPEGSEIFGSILDLVSYGSSFRSADGKVLAMVTSLPEREASREEASITIYDVSSAALNERSGFKIPFRDSTGDSSMEVSLSTGGEIISIKTESSVYEGGCWSVFDLRENPCNELFHIDLGAYNVITEQYFTPDNEFVLKMSEDISRDDELIDEVLKETDLPRFCFAKRVIILLTDE